MTEGFEVWKIKNITPVNQTTYWITLEGTIGAQPGQFVMVWLPGIGEKPFSIASIDPFGLLVVDVGPFSQALHNLSVGNPIWVKGPLGQGYTIDGARLLCIGGGYGSAPLFPLAKLARAQKSQVVVCLGAKKASDILLKESFEDLGCQVLVATEDGSCGTKGLVTAIVQQALKASTFDTLYACGPTGMLSALAKICRYQRINCQLSWEAHMRCGLGLCGSCEVPQSMDASLPIGWLACFDGPVFKKYWELED